MEPHSGSYKFSVMNTIKPCSEWLFFFSFNFCISLQIKIIQETDLHFYGEKEEN